MKTSYLAGLAAAVCLLAQGCGGTAFTLPPVSSHEALVAAQKIEADPSLPRFSRSSSYYRDVIRRLDQQLTAEAAAICARAETEDCRFRFHYLDDDEVNAYANEGGHIYLHRGLLDYLETEEEIAAVMAHEMGHQIADHVSESRNSIALGALLGGLLMGGIAVAGGAPQDAAEDWTNTGMVYGGRVGQLTFSKAQEREADLLAAYILARADVDLERAGRSFEVMAKMDGGAVAGWNDTHPAGAERVVAWRKAIAEVRASPDQLPTMAEE